MVGGGVPGAGDDSPLSTGVHAGFTRDDDDNITKNLPLRSTGGLVQTAGRGFQTHLAAIDQNGCSGVEEN